MSTITGERRRFQRITLSRPVVGKLNGIRVYVVDLSVSGIRIAHQDELQHGRTYRMTFESEGEEIAYDCEVVWTAPDSRPSAPGAKPVLLSGLRLLQPVASSAVALRNFIAGHVMRALDEQKANARGIPPLAATFQSGVKEKIQYVVYRWVKNNWVTAPATTPQQPLDGFTVSSKEDPAQIEMLCKTYEASDFAGRKMIRAMAELSIAPTESVPTRKYTP